MAKNPTPAPTGPKTAKPKAIRTVTPEAPVQERGKAEPSHPALDQCLSEEDRELVRELAIELTYLDHRNPHLYSMGSPKWHSNIRMARLIIRGFRFMQERSRGK